MSADDVEYLERRAEAEIALAQNADDSRVVKVHYDLANFYLERLYRGETFAA